MFLDHFFNEQDDKWQEDEDMPLMVDFLRLPELVKNPKQREDRAMNLVWVNAMMMNMQESDRSIMRSAMAGGSLVRPMSQTN